MQRPERIPARSLPRMYVLLPVTLLAAGLLALYAFGPPGTFPGGTLLSVAQAEDEIYKGEDRYVGEFCADDPEYYCCTPPSGQPILDINTLLS